MSRHVLKLVRFHPFLLCSTVSVMPGAATLSGLPQLSEFPLTCLLSSVMSCPAGLESCGQNLLGTAFVDESSSNWSVAATAAESTEFFASVHTFRYSPQENQLLGSTTSASGSICAWKLSVQFLLAAGKQISTLSIANLFASV